MPSDSLFYRCPRCNADIGSKCKNYKGVSCAPHKERGELFTPKPRRRKQAAKGVQGELFPQEGEHGQK